MKIQCDVCEKAEAEVLCCADEAVLCKLCDANVHAANSLSQKHHRLFLLKHISSSSCSSSSSSAPLPRCERCKERKGYVFCLEDRALLCRQCDLSTHTAATPCVLSHQRFLISGLKVALHDSSTENSTDITTFSSDVRNHSRPSSRLTMPIDNSTNTTTTSFDHFPADRESMAAAITNFDLEAANSTETTVTFPSELPRFAAADWPLDEIYVTHDFNFYDFSEVGSSSRIDGL